MAVWAPAIPGEASAIPAAVIEPGAASRADRTCPGRETGVPAAPCQLAMAA